VHQEQIHQLNHGPQAWRRGLENSTALKEMLNDLGSGAAGTETLHAVSYPRTNLQRHPVGEEALELGFHRQKLNFCQYPGAVATEPKYRRLKSVQ
jgi:hypothetical protein